MTLMTEPNKPRGKKRPPIPRPDPSGGAQPAPAPEIKSVQFKGRTIVVKCPTEEQIFAWERLLTKMESMAKEAATVDTARILLNRCNKIIESVIAEDDDREWLEDGRLDGTITLQESAQIVVDALKAFEKEVSKEPPNRAARRAKG